MSLAAATAAAAATAVGTAAAATAAVLLQLLLSDIFPELINHKIVKPVFAVVVTLLFVCPQVRVGWMRRVAAWNVKSHCVSREATSPADVVHAVS